MANSLNDSISADKKFANQLRQTNSQQFITLVRMHLLQKIELQSLEELDEKKLKKHSKNKRANKSSCTSKNLLSFEEEDPLTESAIAKVRQLITFIVCDDNVCQEGVFRKTGSVARQNELKQLLHQPDDLVLDNYTVHDCASVLKSYLSDLPEPLLTESYQVAYQQISEMCGSSDWNESLEERAVICLQLLFHLLPDRNRTLLEEVNVMLHRTAQHESNNKMNSTSLATLFAPHLICPKHLSAEALHSLALKMTPTISLMIQQGGKISDIPKELATDIRAYLFEQKRRKTMSPAKVLDESISETTANTVFTFCDRQKTAEENTQNQTDTALAKLYAHIQGMPESSKKKKLIKQFNKENGYGTPLQILQLNKEKNSSGFRKVNSLGDTIKRHIFQKNLLSRATKQSNMLMGACASPLSTNTTASPKTRVLFRSTTPQLPPAASTATSAYSIDTILENDAKEVESPTKVVSTDRPSKAVVFGENLGNIQKNHSKHSSEPNLCKAKERRDYFSCGDIKTLAADLLQPDNEPLLASFEEIAENAAGSEENLLLEEFGNGYCPFTSTPAKNLGAQRNSMSPITKSTQRMSKAMQESIMTPRSRKPVMLPQRLLGSAEQQSKTMYHSFSSIAEMDEDNTLDYKFGGGVESTSQRRRSRSEGPQLDEKRGADECPSLTNEFKDYLNSRAELSSPADLSFSSQPDDFESTDEFEDMSESKISKSLLLCLDGHLPPNTSSSFGKESRKRRSDDDGSRGKTIKRTTIMVMADLEETAL